MSNGSPTNTGSLPVSASPGGPGGAQDSESVSGTPGAAERLSLADCPHRPGSPEWKAWQREYVAAEANRRHEAGEYGATADEKAAAGLAPTETKRQNGWWRPLSEIAEPWRSKIVEQLRVPPEAKPLQCPWCRRQYKRPHAHAKHVAGCESFMRLDSPQYADGWYEPLVAPRPWRIVGQFPTAKQQAKWDEAERARLAEAERVRSALGPEALAALAKALKADTWFDVGPDAEALAVAAKLRTLGWTLTRTEP